MTINIKKADYIAITNQVKIRTAIKVVIDIQPRQDGITTKEGISQIMNILYDWDKALSKKINGD